MQECEEPEEEDDDEKKTKEKKKKKNRKNQVFQGKSGKLARFLMNGWTLI